ncbi:MAG: carbamoyltransferase HypF [Acidobacteriota bacterium]
MSTRTQILVRGTVQGVGFRPYVYSLATRRSLKGTVLNNPHGVLIDVEGDASSIGEFVNDLTLEPPPLSVVDSIELRHLQFGATYEDFRIVGSESGGRAMQPVAADVATCEDCLRELFDPRNRRYGYPFLNCTNCGPRFTIVESVPYDRERTTMRGFRMCVDCLAEYGDPRDRRFHAEATCCPACGPRLRLIDQNTGEILGPEIAGLETVRQTQRYLLEGKIVAIKGLGGYHLACDALSETVVNTLRGRKYREDKPFALMASSIKQIEKYCFISPAENSLLSSPERPIVLLAKRPDSDLSRSVAPRTTTLGFMLPYTPLHYLLFADLDRPLVMTSGNVSDEPIAFADDDAYRRLKNIADHILVHDRPIQVRTDDSVVRVLDFHAKPEENRSPTARPASTFIMRRSRGFAPAPIKTSFKFTTEILACGAELKNTFCMSRGDYAYLSHHIGDLENLETLSSFTDGVEHFKRLFDLRPDVIAYDLHPEYLSTKYAMAYEGTEKKIGIQHHHAHIASCMADNLAEGEVIGVAMDGLGFGTDGKLWGGEFFVADLKHAERIAHLDSVPLPGGAKAIREPWRMAAVYLQRAFGEDFLHLDLPFVDTLDRREWKTLRRMSETKTNSPETSSMGRLFDAVSALLGIRDFVNYEGQAAIELEAIADQATSESYSFDIAHGGIIKAEPVIKRAVEDLLSGITANEVAGRFHNAVADLIANVARTIRQERNLNCVALSGGVFQNMLLLDRASKRLKSQGFEVLIHHRVPTNDGGISLGQAAIANAQLG